jgi:serine protease
MGLLDRRVPRRPHLALELLEDRTTPTKLDDAISLALPDLVATGAVAHDRINVVMASSVNTAADTARLAHVPFAAGVNSLGFGIYSVSLSPGADVAGAVAYYGSMSGVLTAAPDVIIQVQQTPNDPSYAPLYGMTKIGAPTAWNTTTGSSNFVVAVIDSGVDYRHPDLAANMWTNPGEIAGNGRDDDANGFVDDVYGADFANRDGNPFDDNSHGTHVAGTIGAVGNNSLGVAGVNWSVKIMALKFLGANGSGYTSNAIAALDYAVAKGAKISNNSWGGGGYDSALAAAIGRAQTAGHVFVAAAGNSGLNIDNTPSYPASYIKNYGNVVTVAATDSNDALASFSNYGAGTVTLAAPGVSILSTTPNNTYSYFSGTSMAAPHVAGALALYWSANPTLSYTQVIAKLKSSVDALPNLNGKVSTGGRLNVAKMFAGSTSPPPPAAVSGPKVIASTFMGTATQLNKLRVTFDRPINPTTFTSADVRGFTGPNGTLSATYKIVAVSGTNNTQFDISFGAKAVAGAYSMVIGPDIRDALGNQMNQNGNAVTGEATADRYTATGNLVLTVNKTYTKTGTVAIPDLSTISSTLNVTEDVKLSDLNVRVTLTHTYVSDLVITLTNPTGKTVTLFNRRGGSGDNLTNTIFDDEAGVSVAYAAAPFKGTFRADGLLSAFDGLSTKGTWTLKVSDVGRLDAGKLTGWALIAGGTMGGGNGGTHVKSLGFQDSPSLPEGDGAPHFDVEAAVLAEPIAVNMPSATSDRDSFAPSRISGTEDANTGGVQMWLFGQSEDRDYEYASSASAGEVRSASELPTTHLTTPRSESDGDFPASDSVAHAASFFLPNDAGDSEGSESFEVLGGLEV